MVGLRASDMILKGASSRFSQYERSSLNFSSSSFIIRVYLVHPQPSLFLDGLFFGVYFILVNYNCHVSFNLKVILYVAKIN